MTTPQPNILNMFRQMMAGGMPMSQRAGMFARMVGRISMGTMGGPLGIGIMAGSMLLPAMMQRGSGGGGDQQTGTALESLADELAQVTSGLHQMNIEIKQLSDSVGQTSADTLKMGGMFASIGSDSPTQASAELASQIGRQTGAMRLGQVNQQAMMGAGMLGMNSGQMMEQSPAEQLRYVVDELRKMSRTQLHSMETLAALEMMWSGQGQNLIAMASMSESAQQSLRKYEQLIEASADGPRGKALEEQSRGLLTIAAQIAMQADLFQREMAYLKTPFAEEQAGRRAERAVVRQQFSLGVEGGAQGGKIATETMGREMHEMFARMFGGTGNLLQTLGREWGLFVTELKQVGLVVVTVALWIANAVKLVSEVAMIPMRIGDKDIFKGTKEAYSELSFGKGSTTQDLWQGLEASKYSQNFGVDARNAPGMSRGAPAMSGNQNMGSGAGGGSGTMTVEFRAKDDFANMLQYGIRESTNQGRAVPGPVAPRVPSIATK